MHGKLFVKCSKINTCIHVWKVTEMNVNKKIILKINELLTKSSLISRKEIAMKYIYRKIFRAYNEEISKSNATF